MQILDLSGYLKSGLEDTIIKKIDKKKELKKQKAKLENKLNVDKEFIYSILATLKQIENNVLELFYLNPTSINKISKIVDREEQTVRYIKMQALKKCDDFIQKSAIQQKFNKTPTDF